MSLHSTDDPDRALQAMIEAARFTLERSQRYALERVVTDAFEPPSKEELEFASDADEQLRTTLGVPNPILFIRATRDALTEWLDERAEEVGGPTTTTPPGWPWETWPT